MTVIYVDGSATFNGSPNPKRGMKGDTYCSYIIFEGDDVVEQAVIPLGKGTINQAEYAAIIHALSRASELGLKNVQIYSDSSVVVHIVNNRENIKHSKIVGADEWTALIHDFIDRHFDTCLVDWIPRQQNRLADNLIGKYQKEGHIVGLIDLLP